MLRLWRGSGLDDRCGTDWRVSLESPQTRERFVFASMAELLTFLEQEMEGADGTDGCNPAHR